MISRSRAGWGTGRGRTGLNAAALSLSAGDLIAFSIRPKIFSGGGFWWRKLEVDRH
jgi:hypothetical protein